MPDDEFGDDIDFSELISEIESPAAFPPARPSVQSRPPPSDRAPVQSAASSSLQGGVGAAQPRPKVVQPTPQAIPARAGPSCIFVSTRQRGNPILSYVKNVPWEYADIPADYVVGQTTCALFLSLKYHRLHPEYIYSRIKLLGHKYNLRLLLTMVDIPNHEDSLKELAKTSIINDLTLIVCWSAAEAGHYLELYKSCEYAQPTAIRTQQAQSYKESLEEFVTTPRAINKSDAASLISTFGSLRNAINALPEQIVTVPGWGDTKVKQWCHAVEEDFKIERGFKSKTQKQKTTETPFSISQAVAARQPPRDEDLELLLAIKESLAEAQRSASAQNNGDTNIESNDHPDTRSAEQPAFTGQSAVPEDGEVSSGIMAALDKMRREK
ncbi:mating-type switching protein swi10 [Ascosphaera apis ARSEF 7405]|uniref:Mating-type switching protein swi10 n=1 Tax=Ascosphaera apis ARSEF 7405 TaxID=392613 RepID=A0A167VJ42_9EURO|nr:mating-type switching protein swi10 [Ascosphaera apis ARSEF 7405]